MKKIFICHTYYHVLISLVKTLKCPNDECDIFLSYTWKNEQLLNDKKILENLRKSDIFKKIIVGNFMSNELNIIKKNQKNTYIKKYKFIKKFQKNIPYNLKEYDEIYIFNDNSPIGLYLIYSRIYYNLLEDGTDCYINNQNIINQKLSIRKIIKKIMKVYELGESKYAKSIEVNCKKGIFLKNKNIVENQKKKMINSLTDDEKSKVINIFIENNKIETLNGKTLIITQPLSEDKILENEEEKKFIYKKIIEEFCKGEAVVIKVHPREITKYEDICENCIVIYETFPLELLNYYSHIKLKRVITITSTSINLIENAEEKIILGWKWLEKTK